MNNFYFHKNNSLLSASICANLRPILAFVLLFFILSVSYAAAFTAATLGDYGNVTVMEVTGNYDANNPDGTTNSEPREEIAKEFFRLHKDEYDFLVIYSNFDFLMPEEEAKGFYIHVKNDIQGIGQEIFDNSELFGSTGKIQGTIDMGNISGLTVDPLDPDFEQTLSLLSHELMHRWGANVRFREIDDSISTALLGKDLSHWSFLLDTDGSVLYGNDWQDNGDGTFTSIGTRKYYSPLDLYLMGLADRSEVSPMLLIDNSNIDPERMPERGVTIDGTPRYITIDDIIAVEGERIPGFSEAQKTFKSAFILITEPGTFTGYEIYEIENIRNGWVTRFSVLTDGQGIIQVTSTLKDDIPENPGVILPPVDPRTLLPNIEDGVQWLINNQMADGSWMDLTQTMERDTAETVLALKNFGIAEQNYLIGIQWLNGVYSGNIDYLSRKIEAFADAGEDVTALLDELLSRQNPDGGWGSNMDYMSNPTDTSFALKSLSSAGYADQGVISNAIEYLKTKQNPDSGWGSDDETSNIQATTNVLSAFNKYRVDYQLDGYIEGGIAWLTQMQNPDGGFPSTLRQAQGSGSTVYATAMAVLTVRELDVSTVITNNALNYILNLQSEDGSWYRSPYQTALAISAVWKATIDPDLSITTNDITFIPSSITSLPTNIVINADIWNLGRTAVLQATVVLYEGAISEENKIGEQILSFPGQSSVTVTFSVIIIDGDEHRFYITVDPENSVQESNELNNTAIKILYPETTYDFEILSSDISVSQDTVDIFEDVTITSRITNRGTMNAYNVQVEYFIDDPTEPFDIATLTVDIPAGETITNEYVWRTNKAGENMPVTVFVDPFNTFAELSEENNTAVTYLTVNDATEPNLTISYEDIILTPNPVNELGSVNISALVKNEGFSEASNVLVNFYKGVPGEDGILLGSQTIASLNTGESAAVSIDWINIMESGERIIYLQVDPDNLITEIREDDNDAFTTLTILSLPDLVISTNSIVFTPSAPKDGDIVSIGVTVQNAGAQDASDVLVTSYNGETLIDSQNIPFIAGNSLAEVSFTYDTTGKSGVHEITVIVDADNVIIELSEDNNRASRSFGVQNADLWLTEPYISPNGDGVKDSTEFFFRLESPQTVEIQIVNDKGETVRTFSGIEFENTTGGNITWDGLDDNGMVVDDGDYQIQIIDENNNILGSLLVIVDNNRSPLTDAIGTEYLLKNNLTCMLPDINDSQWEWFPDESGIIFKIGSDPDTPEYPAGLYTMAPDGEDILKITPSEWSIADYALSPDGDKIAFVHNEWLSSGYGVQLSQLWVMDRDGNNLTLYDDTSDLGSYWIIHNIVWSPDGNYIFYGNGSDVMIIKADGTGKTTIDDVGDYIWKDFVKWTPDSTRVAYAHGYGSNTVRVSDLSGNNENIFTVSVNRINYQGFEWLNNNRLVLIEDLWGNWQKLWLVDASGNGDHIELTGDYEFEDEFSIAPDRQSFAFITSINDTKYVNLSDAEGNTFIIHELKADDTGCQPELSNIIWSPDSKKMAFMEGFRPDVIVMVNRRASTLGENCSGASHLVLIDRETNEEVSLDVSNPEMRLVGWLSDGISIVGHTYSDVYAINSETGENRLITSDAILSWYKENVVSPLEHYITYYKSVEQSSVCYGRGYRDLWAISSLLNLTADLRAIKENSAVTLKGIAADLNFEGYMLEYADTKTPDVWNLVKPPSDIPVVNDVFTTWIPPNEGTFYVRLTVWDKAGNAAWDRKRISWGLSSSITNIYKNHEIFSPNGDNVKDTVELHYRVLEPVHLDFYIYDEDANLIRTFTRDYTSPAEDYINWDGRDEYGSVVPDGIYTIMVFDYEFFVGVDNTPPDVYLEISPIMQDPESYVIFAELLGHAVDSNLKSWIVEYGEGDNPEEWYEYLKDEELLVAEDEDGNPLLDPIQDDLIRTFYDFRIEWLVGKKLKITAEDFAGNRSTVVTGFLDEEIVLYSWDDNVGTIPANLTRPGAHSLKGQETIRSQILSMNVQYWSISQWLDTPPLTNPSSGMIDLEWDNSDIGPVAAVRIKAVDVYGQEYYSNVLSLPTESLFSLLQLCDNDPPSAAVNELFEELTLLKTQVRSGDDNRYSQWTDLDVYDSTQGDIIPEGIFYLRDLPDYQDGWTYELRMIGVGVSEEVYESNIRIQYSPSGCPSDPSDMRLSLSVSYEEMDCGLLSGNAELLAKIEELKGEISLKTLSYYIQETEEFQLLRQFDLSSERWGGITVDTTTMPEGSYPVKAVLTYLDFSDNTPQEMSATNTLIVDRVLPFAEITYPDESILLSPIRIEGTIGDWYAVPVEGIATDNNQVMRYELYYGIGENPSVWMPAMTRSNNTEEQITGEVSVQGQIGLWDVTDLGGTAYSLKLKVIDITGNVSCYTTSFFMDRAVDIAISIDKKLFSPNGDGIFDDINISYTIDEYAAVDIKVFRLIKTADDSYILDSMPLRTIVSGLSHLGGTGYTLWDGRDDSGTVVPDGLYAIVFYAIDSLGNTMQRWIAVEVDNTLPITTITYPQPYDPLGNIVEVKGTADDLHFQDYILEAGQGEAPDEWLFISSKTTPVEDNILGKWNTYDLPEGIWTLRLTATDTVGNKNETTVTVDLEPRADLIKDIDITPGLFSPNNDGMLDTTDITYELTDACDVLIEIFDADGALQKTYTTAVPSAGTYTYTWDGTDNTGVVVPDGDHTVKLTAALSSDLSVTQQEAVTAIVDLTPPTIDITNPLDNSYLKDTFSVEGTITDLNLTEYSISYTGDAGEVLLDNASQSREDYTFVLINDLSEGNYTLNVAAKDLGENTTEVDIQFTIDMTPPEVTLETPQDEEYYGSDNAAINIAGDIEEDNLEVYSLGYGAGENPLDWTELLTGDTLPVEPQLFTWQVGENDGIPDGLYTLSLYAIDKAGLEGEARVRITIDNTLPEVSITSPQEGDYVKEAVDITGRAFDRNLDNYTLEISEGDCSSAFRWAVIKTAVTSVQDGILAIWQALPPDGDYCLRLTAVDKVGNNAETGVNVTVDTQPPAAPALSGEVENRTDARLIWTENTEPDLSGYNIYRNNQKVNDTPIIDIGYLDQGLDEGIYTYTVTAVDIAGWESEPSNEVILKIDLTGPDARIRSPLDGSLVSDIIDINGTAYSSDDFKEYRVYIGYSLAPTTWTLIRTSPVPIPYGRLTQWDTIGIGEDEVYSIKLEAEDISGNINTHQITVTIENTPPAAPLLISAVPDQSDVTIAWLANTEPDLAGYLLYRNDQLANVEGIVIGDLKPYLITGTTYLDEGLPDGTFRYYLVAMDEAGNISAQSNTLEVDIDTRPPHATIVEPEDGSRFEETIMIKAESPDLDIAAIQFEYKKAEDSGWIPLGGPVTIQPYITYLDPEGLGLTYDDYHLRAVAVDNGGRTDPTPEFITVTYTDLTAPDAPIALSALTNGNEVTLTWTANTEPDIDGYNIYRTLEDTKTKVNTAVVQDTTYLDTGLADGVYTYEVTAVDTYGNESDPSNTVRARVYTPVIEQPYTPTGESIIEIQGSDAETDSTVEITIEDVAGSVLQVTSLSDSGGNFTTDITLSLEENKITAQVTDSAGNISRTSEMVVVVYNEPPAAPTGLASTVQDYNVTLTWNVNTELDLSGYNLYRNGEKVNIPVAVTPEDVSNITASSYISYNPPSNAFDSDPLTYWRSYYSYESSDPFWWEIELNSPELINHIEIDWVSETYAGMDFEIQVWSGYAWITQVNVTGNTETVNTFDFNPSYRTDRIRIYITSTTNPGYYENIRISEVRILKDNLITETSYEDIGLNDGEYNYTVTAVDYYGFESLPSDEIPAIVGDVLPPSAPINLTATASGVDIILNWSANTEPDLGGYNIYRETPEGWSKLNESLITENTYTDASLLNRTYTYRVTAVDVVGNESEPSNEASATIYIDPPEPPINLSISPAPEGEALSAVWEYTGSPVAGYNLYRGTTSGGPYEKVNDNLINDTTYLDTGLINGVAYYYVVVAVDSFGNESAYSNEAMGIPSDTIAPPVPEIFFPTIPQEPVTLYRDKTDISGISEPGTTVELFKDGVSEGMTIANAENDIQSYSLGDNIDDASISPDGETLAYKENDSIWLMSLDTGETTQIIPQGGLPLWSPDGNKLAYEFEDESWNIRIGIYDIEAGDTISLAGSTFIEEMYPSWSSDGNMIAFIGNSDGFFNVWIKDLVLGSFMQVTNSGYASNPKLSPDGEKLAYFESSNLYVIDLLNNESILVDDQTGRQSIEWSPDSKRLLFISYMNGNSDIYVYDVDTGDNFQITDSNNYEYYPGWSPDGHNIVYARWDIGSYSIWITPLETPEQSTLLQQELSNLNYLSWAKPGGVAYIAYDLLNILYLKGHFSFKDIGLDPGENIFHAASTDDAGNVSPPSEEITVIYDTSLLPDLETTDDDIYIYPPYPVAGEEVTINIVVWNNGQVEVEDVDVDLYIWDSTGILELVKSENIPYMAPDSGEFIGITWDTTGKTGMNTVIVVVDPEDKILELSETNNYATRDFYVSDEEGVSITTTIDSDEYRSSQDVNIYIDLRNSGFQRDVLLEVWIEDENGNAVTLLDTMTVNLPYASEQNYSFAWNTGYTYAGSYRVHTVVKDVDVTDVLAENIVPFIILPDIDIESTIVTDKTGYGPGEDVFAEVSITNNGQNYIIPELNVRVRIVDTGDNDLFVEDKDIINLLPGVTSILSSTWNTGLNLPGDYSAVVEIYLVDQLISSSSALFRIDEAVIITGDITATPSVVLFGSAVQTDYTIRNNGNVDVSGLIVDVLVMDPETQSVIDTNEETIDLVMSSSVTGQAVFSTLVYSLKTYVAVLQYTYQSETRTLDTTTFTVIDGTPPVVDIISPVSGSNYSSEFDIAVTATDDASGVDRVEYQIDSGEWRLLPIADPTTGRYATTWVPAIEDEGTHTISFRAVDNAGNMSEPVLTTVIIEVIEVITGTIAASPDPVYQGQDETLTYTITNNGNEDINNLDVTILIVDAETEELKQTLETIANIPMDTTITDNFSASTSDLTPKLYLAILQVSSTSTGSALQPETLDSTTFEVMPSLEITKTIPDLKNILVWLNYPWDTGQDTPDRLLIEQALNETGVNYYIVLDKKDFQTEIRNPYYTDFLILGDHNPIEDHFSEELREQIYSGKGLISSMFNRQNLDEEVFGIEFRGYLSDSDYLIELTESEISTPGDFQSYGRAKRVEVIVEVESILGWIVETTDRYPGIIKNEYGDGNVLFFGFDLGLSSQNYELFETLLGNSLSYIHTPTDITAFHPNQLVPVEIEIKSLGGVFDLRITETYPEGIKLYSPSTSQWITENPWIVELHLEPDETKTVLYYALTPDTAGAYTLETEVGYIEDEIYNFYQSLSIDIVVDKDADTMIGDIITELNALVVSGQDRAKVNNAVRYMENVRERVITADNDIEQNIDDILKAIGSLLSVTSVDIADIRLMMDELLEVWEGRYYR